MEKKKEAEILSVSEIKQEIINYSRESLNMERDREKNALRQSTTNLTTISILLVALFTVVFELLDRLSAVSYLITIFGIILSLVLFASMFFSIKSQWCYKKAYRKTGDELLEHINTHLDEYSKQEAFQDQMINDIGSIQKYITLNNNKRVVDMMVSSILIYVFLFLLLSFLITILIVL